MHKLAGRCDSLDVKLPLLSRILLVSSGHFARENIEQEQKQLEWHKCRVKDDLH